MKRDFLSIADWSSDELINILDTSRKMKENPSQYLQTLRGKSFALIFEKQSLRTHVTFDVGINQLGGHSVYLTQADISLGKRESIYDTAKNLERWVQGIIMRTFAHQTCLELAKTIRVPVINALTDYEHPCQAVGDFFTLMEKLGELKGKKFVFIGDGNNVCHSLMLMSVKMGMDFVATTPPAYAPDPKVVKLASEEAKDQRCAISVNHNPKDAMKQADVIYTDVWTSMGQEVEREQRLKAFRGFQVNAIMMNYAKSNSLFMHCLPAHRGEEVTDEVMDSPQSVVFDQAENRLHTQKAILFSLMKGE